MVAGRLNRKREYEKTVVLLVVGIYFQVSGGGGIYNFDLLMSFKESNCQVFNDCSLLSNCHQGFTIQKERKWLTKTIISKQNSKL